MINLIVFLPLLNKFFVYFDIHSLVNFLVYPWPEELFYHSKVLSADYFTMVHDDIGAMPPSWPGNPPLRYL